MKKETMKDFAELLKSVVVNYLPDEYADANIEICRVWKVNRMLTGLVIKRSRDCVAPTVYINDMYEYYTHGDLSLDNAAKKVVEITLQSANTVSAMRNTSKLIADFNSLKKSIYIRVYNATASSHLNCPYVKIADDLIAVCYIHLDSQLIAHNEGIANVTNGLLSLWKVDFIDLFEIAKKNMLAKVKYVKTSELLLELIAKDLKSQGCPDALASLIAINSLTERNLDFENFPIYTLTNKEMHLGAGMLAIPELMDSFASDPHTVIIPSSIHEVLLLNTGETDHSLDNKSLREMVSQINQRDVPIDDCLSYNIYRYDVKTQKLIIL